MPDYNTDGKHGLRALEGTNPISDIDAGFEALRDDIDSIIATDDQGALASRPVSTAPSPGKAGRYYKANDVGRLARDHGTGWEEIIINPPVALATRGSTQSVTTGPDQIALTTELADLPGDDQHSSNSGRLISQRGGIYAVSAFCVITSTGGGAPYVGLRDSGVTIIAAAELAAGETLVANLSCLVVLSVGGYIDFIARNIGGGGSVTVQAGASMGWHYVRSLIP